MTMICNDTHDTDTYMKMITSIICQHYIMLITLIQFHRSCYLVPKLSEVTPLKINMEHNHGGLEDHFPF